MNRFGVDKPDLRFGMELVELTDVFAATEFKAFAGAGGDQGHPGAGRGRRVRPQPARQAHRPRQVDRRQGPGVVEGRPPTALDSPVAKFLSDAEQAALRERLGVEPGDLVLIVADEWATTCEVLGQLRNDLGRPPVHEGPYRYVWVVEFPLFVGIDEATGHPKPGHHPFCRPHPDDLDRLDSDPMSVRALAYDLVLNGWELGSGSIRIHEPELQRRVFAALGIDEEAAEPQVRVLPQPVRVRRAAARRVRVRRRPAGGDPRRRGEHPRGDRVPQDPVGHRPDDQRADPRRSAPPGRTGAADPASDDVRRDAVRDYD